MARWGMWVRSWAGVALALIGVSARAEPPPPTSGQAADTTAFEDQIRPVLTRNCVACHSGDAPKGNLRLDNLVADFDNAASKKQWLTVMRRIEAGEMPPEEQPRPPDKDVHVLTNWITPRLAEAEAEARAVQGRVVLRRLNRVEYENTLCDLLGIKLNLKEQLPADGSADGFDNAGAAHHTSSFLLEKYLEVADTALNLAIANRPQPPPLIEKRYSIKESHTVRATTEDVYRMLENGDVVCFCSSEWHNVGLTPFYPPDAGEYRFRISASGFQSADKPVTFRVTASGTNLAGKSGLISYFDAAPDKPTVFEFVRYMEPRTTIFLLPYGLAGANTVKMTGGEKWDGSGLAIQYVEVEGPLHETWPPESHRRIFGDLPQQAAGTNNFPDRVEVTSEQPLVDAERILTNFARSAFRRRVTAEDLCAYLAIVESKLGEGYTFELAMRAALKGVLISPEFLFLQERPGTLDDFAWPGGH